MKKAIFYLLVVIGVLACLSGNTTALQLLPVAIAAVLVSLDIYGNRDLTVYIFVLSFIMVLVNVAISSWIDVILWLVSAVVFIPRQEVKR